MTSRADRLLCCAVAYNNAEVKDMPIPVINSTVSTEDVIQNMMNVLWFEAKEGMKQVMTEAPIEPYLHAVDIDTTEPGIVSSKNKMDIHRRQVPLPQVQYKRRDPIKLYNTFNDLTPQLDNNDAIEKAILMTCKEQKKCERSAKKELKCEQESIDKLRKREDAKRKRQEETAEERKIRLAEMREKRAQKRAEKEQDDMKKDATSDDGAVQSLEVEANLSKAENEQSLTNVAVDVQELLEAEAADVIHHSLLPQRVRAKNRKTRFFPSPVPFDRHLGALEACWPSQHIKEALIDLIPDARMQLIQGPPGTGKTTELLAQIKRFPESRIFICACTNVGAANLYTRAINDGIMCSLLMPQSRIPPGTPVTSQNPNGRIICSTISGRAGPILDSEVFDVVLVDEAAQCMEAWMWGIIRPEVGHIIMAGDTAQLPALVSERGRTLGHDRSMMQRLMESNYPFQFLNVQRRMHPEIVKFPNKKFYNNELDSNYNLHKTIPSIPHYCIKNVQGECHEIGTSFLNEVEALYCVKLATELKDCVSNDVILLCPYQAQARQLLSLGSGIPVHTIDSFQGREADVVVLSIVRTSSCGFWSDPRRLCVALTRAKHVLHIVGNCKEWTHELKELYQDAKERDCIVDV